MNRAFRRRDRPKKQPRPAGAKRGRNEESRSLTTLAETKADPNGVVMLVTDGGEQLLLAASGPDIRCSEEVLQQLLTDLDGVEWPGHVPGRPGLEYKSTPGFEEALGGSIWCQLAALMFEGEIEQVLSGKQDRIVLRR